MRAARLGTSQVSQEHDPAEPFLRSRHVCGSTFAAICFAAYPDFVNCDFGTRFWAGNFVTCGPMPALVMLVYFDLF